MQTDRPSSDIDSMPGPLSEAPWSPDFVMQAIEILPVSLRQGRLWSLRPEHAESFVLAWPAGALPEGVAAQAMVQLGLEPTAFDIVATCGYGSSADLYRRRIARFCPAALVANSGGYPCGASTWRRDCSAIVYRGDAGARAWTAPLGLAQEG